MSSSLLRSCRFPAAGTAVTCAVSGGADSLALLVLATEAGCRVRAVHVDHGLRPESAAEAGVVRDAAARYGAEFVAERAVVQPGANVEARARAARYAVLPPDVLTGHTADDQAETVLLNLLRGAGLTGLSGMDGGRHPLLRLRRRQTHELCRAEGLQPVDDPTNGDVALRRNRVRHELVPLLDAIAERDVSAVIARQTDLLRDDAEFLDALASAVDPTDAWMLREAPAPLARRAVRRWLAEDHPPDAPTVERVLAVARGDALATDVGGHRRVARSHGRLRLESSTGSVPERTTGSVPERTHGA